MTVHIYYKQKDTRADIYTNISRWGIDERNSLLRLYKLVDDKHIPKILVRLPEIQKIAIED